MALDLLMELDGMFVFPSVAGGSDGGSVPPSPDGWATRRYPLVIRLTRAIFTLVTVFLAAGAVSGLVTGELEAGALYAVFATYLGHIVGLAWCSLRIRRCVSRSPTIASTPDGDGVRIAYSRWSYYWLTAMLILAQLTALGLAVVIAVTAPVAGVVIAIVPLVGAGVIGRFLVAMLRLAPGEVVFSPAGVFHRALTFTVFVPWDAVHEVSAQWLNVPVIVLRAVPAIGSRVDHHRGWPHTVEHRFLPFVVIRTSWLATDPATVYHALAFYHARPELRPELATTAALGRIASGQAVVSQ